MISGNPQEKTEAQAWRAVAEQCAAGDGTVGLCEYLSDVAPLYTQRQTMKARLNAHRAAFNSDWTGTFVYEGSWARAAVENKEARVLAALWLALEAEEGL